MTPAVFGFTGITLSGNMGGSAMLTASMQQLRTRFPGAKFLLFSLYGERDRAINPYPDLEVIDIPSWLLVGWYLPLSCLAALCPPIRNGLARYLIFFDAVARTDAIIDLSGIAFVDGRGLALLCYNAACALPGLALDKPVFKLSQALGPFEHKLNRTVAKLILSRCASVVARGPQSYSYLRSLDLPNLVELPDVSFALDIPSETHSQARQIYEQFKNTGQEWIVISPSEVVNRLCKRRGIDFVKEMEHFIRGILRMTQADILILPHSLGAGRSKNNDVSLCKHLHSILRDTSRVHIFVGPEDPVLLRAVIGQGTFFIGARFHAVAAALSLAVPTLVLGWSHKYEEMVAKFSTNVVCIDFSRLTADDLLSAFLPLWRGKTETKRILETNRINVCRESLRNFALIEQYFGNDCAAK